MLLKNKTCLITGVSASSGIGYAVACLFAAQGARLVILGSELNEERTAAIRGQLVHLLGGPVDILGYGCDLTDYEACQRAVQDMVRQNGALDVLVHAAGSVASQPTLEMSVEDFRRMIDVNLVGTFNINQPVLAQMVSQGGGVIVNIASVAAQRGGGLVGGSHYAASKGGVVSFTKSIAREFGERGIRANTICPALIQTPMLQGVPSEQLNQITGGMPLGRLGQPSEVADACLFLASGLSSFITGSTIDVNGGLHIH